MRRGTAHAARRARSLGVPGKATGLALAFVIALGAAGCGPKPIYRSDPLEPGRPAAATTAPAAPAPAGPVHASKSELEVLAQPWLGTPYRLGGTGQAGIDCSSLAQHLLGDLGVSLPRMVRHQRMKGRPVSRSDLGPGDLVFFRLDSTRVNHVGVALGGGRFVHSSASRGVVIDRLRDRYYLQRYAEARRVLE